MENPSQKVTRLVSQACSSYPGGLRAVFLAIQEKSGRKRSESTFYADFNPNPTSLGNLKVADMMAAMEVTGDYEALRFMAASFGFALMSLASNEPDAPTTEWEMLQDYPAVVSFHQAIRDFEANQASYETVLAKLDFACQELRQTATKARK